MVTRLLTGGLLLLATAVRAQDPQSSQVYANPLYHNPAYAGSAGVSRLILNYRNQWPSLGPAYQTTAFSFDSYLEEANLGLGVQAMHDAQGPGTVSNSLAGQAAYTLHLTNRQNQDAQFIFGLQATYTSRQFDLSNQTFVDQLSASGITGVSVDPLAKPGLTYHTLDFSPGILFEHDLGDGVNYSVGATIHHLGKSWRTDPVTNQRISAMAGLTFPFSSAYWDSGRAHEDSREKNITLTTYLRSQGRNLQLDAGVNMIYSPLMVGLWYRGIPLRTYDATPQRDALMVLAGFQYDRYLVQYSYDVTVSSLSWASGGAHELTIWYGLDTLFGFRGGKSGGKRRGTLCPRY